MADEQFKLALAKLEAICAAYGSATLRMRDATIIYISKEKLKSILDSLGDEPHYILYIADNPGSDKPLLPT